MRHTAKEISERARLAEALMDPCRVCPRRCGAHRLGGETGECRAAPKIPLASFGPHFGEESPLVGSHGSGTIFLGGCNLHCIFCQNADISQVGPWEEVGPEEVARLCLLLQSRGCHNINFVSPTHVMPRLLEALALARAGGLVVPVVYNCGGYDSVEMLKLCDGVVDIYMPDFKYWDEEAGRALSDAPDYPERAREAFREMHRQVGDLATDEQGVAVSGMLVRHLVLPHGLSGTSSVARFLADEISTDTYINIMSQYRPCFQANQDSRLMRGPSAKEMEEAFAAAARAGLHRFDERRFRLFALW